MNKASVITPQEPTISPSGGARCHSLKFSGVSLRITKEQPELKQNLRALG